MRSVTVVPDHAARFWVRFLDSDVCPPDANESFYEAFQVGRDERDADVGAELIFNGEKTATSSLLWEYEAQHKPLPTVGSLSIVEDGRRQPICVVRTSSMQTINFGEINENFARTYGECDGTTKGWYRVFRPYYSQLCESLGKELSDETPLVCEQFEVVFP